MALEHHQKWTKQPGKIKSDIEYKLSDGYNSEYNKLIITPNKKIGSQKEEYIYVQLKIDRSVIEYMANKEYENSGQSAILGTLDNVAEINSYSTFDSNGNVYAGIDKDSAPGNAVPGNKSTYEDDTDSAPPLTITRVENRNLTGKVFLDSTTNELKTGEIRQGTGMYEDDEKGIPNVKVRLREVETGRVYYINGANTLDNSLTNENGEFAISGFIPGNYELIYTWGDQTYTVQNYKGTVYDETRSDENRKNKFWYKGFWHTGQNKNDPNLRYTDAIDDWETRKKIDDQLKNVKYNSNDGINITKMDSKTPIMGMTIEYPDSSTITASITGGIAITDKYEVRNVDFGIVERARQEVELTKRVKTLKLTLANGQVISDVEFKYDRNGKLTATGEKSHMTFMGTNLKGDPKGRFIKLELDNELIQGANLEVGYEILFKNKSEKDYNEESFYKYGTFIDYNKIVKITPTAIIDYLDRDWSFEESKNTDWKALTLEELKTKDKVAKTVYDKTENTDTDINNRIILYTEKLSEKALSPNETNNVMLNVSKILTTTEEISLINETEVVELNKNGGSKIISVPGNYVPGSGVLTDDADEAEEVIVTPSTGENLNYVLPITIGLLALITLGTGVILIKKKVLDNNKE